MKLLRIMFLIVFCFANLGIAMANPGFPGDLKAIDAPNDAGKAFFLIWTAKEKEVASQEYIVDIAESKEGPWYEAESISAILGYQSDFPAIFGFGSDTKKFHAVKIDNYKKQVNESSNDVQKVLLENHKAYYFRVSIRENGGRQTSTNVVTATATGNLFAFNKTNNLIFMLIIVISVLFFIVLARKNPDNIFLRRIAGLEAVEEALGRATEMGKPVFFVHGIAGMDNISTIASINLLGQISEKVAEFDTTLKVTNYDPIVMAVSQETVKEAYIKAGRPDAYNQDNVAFTAADQFSYAAAVDGMMVREKPAANFFMGYFYAESLLLSETGASTGAIQIAGTDAYTQLPFFITTCDYTLMGEELYAASAYLSREPKLLGSLKGQDICKGMLIVIILLGSLLASTGFSFLTNFLKSM